MWFLQEINQNGLIIKHKSRRLLLLNDLLVCVAVSHKDDLGNSPSSQRLAMKWNCPISEIQVIWIVVSSFISMRIYEILLLLAKNRNHVLALLKVNTVFWFRIEYTEISLTIIIRENDDSLICRCFACITCFKFFSLLKQKSFSIGNQSRKVLGILADVRWKCKVNCFRNVNKRVIIELILSSEEWNKSPSNS